MIPTTKPELPERIFAAIRPHDARIQERVFALLEGLGCKLGAGMSIAPKTPSHIAARRINEFEDIDLLLLPFHVHRDSTGRTGDGVEVASLLSTQGEHPTYPILMPVSTFSLHSSFPRRQQDIAQARPEIHRRIIVMPETEIGSYEVRSRLLRSWGVALSGPVAREVMFDASERPRSRSTMRPSRGGDDD